MFKTPLVFLLGIYFGQQFDIPNIKIESIKIYNIFIESDLYNKLIQ